MKVLVLGLVLFALICGFCLWSGTDLSRRFERVIAPIEQASAALEQGRTEQARRLGAEAFRLWEKNYPHLAVFLDHNDIDDVTLAFASLEGAQDEDLPSSYQALLTMLKNLAEADLILPHNLL